MNSVRFAVSLLASARADIRLRNGFSTLEIRMADGSAILSLDPVQQQRVEQWCGKLKESVAAVASHWSGQITVADVTVRAFGSFFDLTLTKNEIDCRLDLSAAQALSSPLLK